MKHCIWLILLSTFALTTQAQYKINASGGYGPANLNVAISEEMTLSDIRVRITKELNPDEADFSVGLVYDEASADFVLTRNADYDLRINTNVSENSADIRIRAGQYTDRPDVKIAIVFTGKEDYSVYVDKVDVTLNDVVIALLPAINKEMGYQYDLLPKLE